MSMFRRAADALAGRDPARARLTTAVAVSAGVLASALAAEAAVRLLHADPGLLAVGIFLSVQSATVVKDATPGARVVTTALLLPGVLGALALATALVSQRALLVVAFIVITGAAVWVRRFGPRASALGFTAFMGFFFALVLRAALDDLPAFAVIAAMAVLAQLGARTVLLMRRPRHEIEVLLTELRGASRATMRAALRPRRKRAADPLTRIDVIARAISARQHAGAPRSGPADDDLDARVLDARVDTEEAYRALACATALHGRVDEETRGALTLLGTILDEGTTPRDTVAAIAQAERIGASRPAHLVARCAIAHARLRVSDRASDGPAAAASPPASRRVPPRTRRSARRPPSWRRWAPTSRMAVQAMLAAGVAAAVGEAISASRWYWAVMTAFVIFVGATTRGAILTRAYRRVLGTGVGLALGLGAVALVGGSGEALVAIAVLSVFGMLYLGPLNYLYTSLFMTLLLVSVYRLLGILDPGVVELRLVETVSGAAVGVLCAYLILSMDSGPTLVTVLDGYFVALDRLLEATSSTLAGSDDDRRLVSALHDLDARQADVDQTRAGASAALVLAGIHRASDTVDVMHVVTRSAALLTRSALELAGRGGAESDAGRAVHEAIDRVRRSATAAHAALITSPNRDQEADPGRPPAERSLADPDTPAGAALAALSRMDGALRRRSRPAPDPSSRACHGG